MAVAEKVSKKNHGPMNSNGRFPVYAEQFNKLVDVVRELNPTEGDLTATTVTTTGVNSLTGGIVVSNTVTEYTVDRQLSSLVIVGTGPHALGSAAGQPVVAAPGAGYALQFVGAVLIYDYATSAYTGGAGDDLTFYINSVAVSNSVATADLITKTSDTILNVNSLDSIHTLTENVPMYLKCTEVTQPQSAAGLIRVKLTYRVIETGL